MNERHAYALAHPINRPRGGMDPRLRSVRKHPRGFNLSAILAVDR
jgi:hypothetical protein